MSATKRIPLPPYLPANQVMAVEVDGRPVGIAKVKGEWRAFEDSCTHAACSFSGDGDIEDGVLICGCHGAKFDMQSGAPLRGPALEAIYIYKIEEKDGGLDITVG